MPDIAVFYNGPVVTRDEAQAAGLKWYFTGIPCKHGHIAKRRTRHYGCYECRHIEVEIYRKTAKGMAANRANVLRYARTEHGIAIRSAIVARYQETAKYKLGRTLREARRRARQAAATGSFTMNDARKLRNRQKKCHICKKPFTKSDPATFDHVIALAIGGAHDASNIALAHFSCNSRKQDRRTQLI